MTETTLNKKPVESADLGEETLKAIEARCEAATPGPWRTEDCYSGVTTNVVCADRRTHGYGCGNDFICDLNDGEYHEYMSIGEQKANAEFIANAREDLPRLLTAYRAVKSENERLREVCTAWDRFAPYLAAHGQIAISDAPSDAGVVAGNPVTGKGEDNES